MVAAAGRDELASQALFDFAYAIWISVRIFSLFLPKPKCIRFDVMITKKAAEAAFRFVKIFRYDLYCCLRFFADLV